MRCSSLIVASLIGGVLVAPSLARADVDPAWAVTFAPGALAAEIAPGQWTAVVVEAGPRDPSTDAAAVALREGLRASGRMAEVLDDAGLGPIETLADAELLKRAAALPVHLVFILRAPSTGTNTAFALGMYDREGQRIKQYRIMPGAPIGRGPLTYEDIALEFESRGQAHVMPPDVAERFILVRHPEVTGNPDGLEAVQGAAEQKKLVGVELYRTLQRKDLEEDFLRRRTIRYSILFPGLAIAGAGLLTTLVATYTGSGDTKVLLAGYGIGLGGGVIALCSLAVKKHPVNAPAVRDMIDQYDDALISRRAAVEIGIAPVIHREGGGLSLAGTF